MATISKEQAAINANNAVKNKYEADKKASELASKIKKGNNSSVKKISYTLFASGLNYGGRTTEMKEKNYKDDIAIIFDSVVSHSLSLSTEKTSYPIDSRATRSDHAINADGEFSFTAYVNSSPMYIIDRNYIDQDTDKEKPVESNRPKKAYDALRKIREERSVVTLVTEDFILTDYLITSLDIKRDTSEGSALVFDLTLQEFRDVVVGKTTISGGNSKKNKISALQGKKNEGNKTTGDKDLEFTEMKSPIKTKVGKAVESQLEQVGITVPKIDAPAGVIKPGGAIVRY